MTDNYKKPDADDLKARLRGSCYLAFEDGTNDYGSAPDAADRIEQLEEALAQSQAEVAAAYERAADAAEDYPRVAPDYDEWTRYDEQIAHSQRCIRALSTPDQTAALDAVRAQGMREAAAIADDYVAMRTNQIETEKSKAAININLPQIMRWGAGKVQSKAIRDAILEAITKGAKA